MATVQLQCLVKCNGPHRSPQRSLLVPVIRILAFGGPFWGTLIDGNYQIVQDSDLEVEGSRMWEIQVVLLFVLLFFIDSSIVIILVSLLSRGS